MRKNSVTIYKLRDRIRKKSNINNNGCWIYSGSTDAWGYPVCRVFFEDIKLYKYSRVSYYVFKGPFDSKLSVLHKCDNPKCVNPEHLFLGTNSDNVKDALKKNRHVSQRYNFKGDNNPRAVLNILEVKIIKMLLKCKFYHYEIEDVIGKGINVIRDISRQKTWKHINV